MSFTDGSFYVLRGEERGSKMCILPLASSDIYPLLLASHLNWVSKMIMRAVSSRRIPGSPEWETGATQESSHPLIGTLNHCVSCHSWQGWGGRGAGSTEEALITSSGGTRGGVEVCARLSLLKQRNSNDGGPERTGCRAQSPLPDGSL